MRRIKKWAALLTALAAAVCVGALSSLPALADGAVGQAIYVDGAAGDDARDGQSRATAVKTFAKAKALAEAGADTIFVAGTVNIEGEITMGNAQIRLVRAEGFTGHMLSVGQNKTATLRNVTVDGNGGKVTALQAMVAVRGTLNIEDGAVLENNKVVPPDTNRRSGGAVIVYGGTVNMRGGVIRKNQATEGAGVALEGGAKMEMTGGVIEENLAKRHYDRDVRQYYAAGGGIRLANGAALTISDDAVIRNNVSDEVGGGISVGATDWSSAPDMFYMKGGLLEGNTAGAAGGGLFVQAGFEKRVSKAFVSAGRIVNNVMDGTGMTNSAFGGGGIYVNGMPEQAYGYTWSNGELHLTNAAIYGNRANVAGGGMASCPVSKTYVHLQDGVALYGNEAGSARDFYLMSNKYFGVHGGEPTVKLAERMLGGLAYHWKDDQGKPFDVTALSEVIPHGTHLRLQTDSVYSQAEIDALAKVVITGNRSVTRGGGIGSNGTVILGKDTPKKDVEIVKTWAAGTAPADIEVELRGKTEKNDWLIEKVRLNEGNGYRHVVAGLPHEVDGKNVADVVYVREPEDGRFIVRLFPAESVPAKKTLSFRLERPEFSDNENLTSTYFNYHMANPETGLFDPATWELKPFTVRYVLEDGEGKALGEGTMAYKPEDGSWLSSMNFADVPADTDAVKVEYVKDNGDFFLPAELMYKLRLIKRGDETVLQVPDLLPTGRGQLTGTEADRVIRVLDLKVEMPQRERIRLKLENSKLVMPGQVTVSKTWKGVRPEDAPPVYFRLLKDGVPVSDPVQYHGYIVVFPVDDASEVGRYSVAEVDAEGKPWAFEGYAAGQVQGAQGVFAVENEKLPPPTPTPSVPVVPTPSVTAAPTPVPPTPTPKAPVLKVPKTGDGFALVPVLALTAAAGIGMLTLQRGKKER